MVKYLLWRISPTVVTALWIYIRTCGAILIQLDQIGPNCIFESKTFFNGNWWYVQNCDIMHKTILPIQVQHAILQSRDVVMLYFVICMFVQSANLMYRVDQLKNYSPFKNTHWRYAVGIVFFAQLLYTILYGYTRDTLQYIPGLFYDIYAVYLIGPLIVVWVGERMKRKDALLWLRFNGFRRLEFNTKLGMHSPR